MKSEVSANDLLKFEEEYRDNSANLATENDIQKFGLLKTATTSQKYKFKFNIEVPKSKIYHRGGFYAFLRVVKDVLRQQGQAEVANLNLSANFLNFYDKLEKANALYNDLISNDDLSLAVVREKADWYLRSFSTFHLCRELVNKYGLALAAAKPAPEPDEQLVLRLLGDKVKTDATAFLKMSSKVEKISKKSGLMYEVYQFLTKIYGLPPTTFDCQGETFTPLEFKEHFLGEALEDYVTVTPLDKETLLESYAYMPNLYLHDSETTLHHTPAKIKEAIVKQLIGGVSVWLAAEDSRDNEWVLDDKFYDFGKLLGMADLPVTWQMALGMISYDQAMCLTGALTKKNIAEQFRAEDGSEQGKYGGQRLMTNSFLEHNVITLSIHKKYLV